MKFQLLLLAVALFAVLALVESRPLPRRDCWADSECNSSVEYCKRRVGHCNSEGFCASRPTDCASTGTPVCTCTGETLENDCSAAAAGVTVAYEGECTN